MSTCGEIELAQHEMHQARERVLELGKEIQHNVELFLSAHKRVLELEETTNGT
jgi:hypothetical protein